MSVFHCQSMSKDTSNGNRLETLVRLAAQVAVASESRIGYRHAMELVGFPADEVTNAAIYKWVIRRSKALVALAANTPVAVVQTATNSSISSFTHGSQGSPVQDPVCDLVDDLVQTPLLKAKKHRQSVNAKNNAVKERQKVAIKVATNRIKRNLELPAADPSRKLIRVIVQEVNDMYKANVQPQTAVRYVRKGMAGTSPLKTGPVGDFPKHIYESSKGAFQIKIYTRMQI
jgi:hypothetical protein